MPQFDSVTYDEEADVLYVELNKVAVDRSHSLDDIRIIDYSKDGAVVGIEFINASSGVDLSDVPFAQKVEKLIGETGLEVPLFA
jgi:uncharacterized protein YuzE